jgi:Ca2+-binding EF-hand superfamily protein
MAKRLTGQRRPQIWRGLCLNYSQRRIEMLSELRTRKFSSLFACFDFDKNGILEKADYEHFAQNLSQAYALTPGTATYAKMYVETMALWDFVQTIADHDGDQQVSQDEFIAAYGALTDNDETFQQLLMSYAEFVIRMGDRDSDGRLNEDEYATILWCYGIADDAGRTAFRHLVTDSSGYLTLAAMEKVFAEFFRSDDPAAPGNWMIGPI